MKLNGNQVADRITRLLIGTDLAEALRVDDVPSREACGTCIMVLEALNIDAAGVYRAHDRQHHVMTRHYTIGLEVYRRAPSRFRRTYDLLAYELGITHGDTTERPATAGDPPGGHAPGSGGPREGHREPHAVAGGQRARSGMGARGARPAQRSRGPAPAPAPHPKPPGRRA